MLPGPEGWREEISHGIKSGNLVAKGMKLDGTANTSSIGADVINCNHLEVQDALECGGV